MIKITKNRVKTIGKKLRQLTEGETLSVEDLQDLTAWRDSHGPSLNYLSDLLANELETLELSQENYSVTQRLKRFYSIKLKLERFSHLQLSMMDDIAGARVIVPTLKHLDELFDRLKERNFKYTLLKVNNYISNPKPDGYRSLHLVYRTQKDLSVQIELQLRTHLQHIFATAVEVFGTLIKTSFKTGSGEKKWREFFKLLSSQFAIIENRPLLPELDLYSKNQLRETLVAAIKNLNVIEKLNAYTAIYHSSWKTGRGKGRRGKYALLILDNKKNRTTVDFFSEKNKLAGITRYAQIESQNLDNDDINAVFVSVDNMNKLQHAYPNYFMDTKILTHYLSQIVLGQVNFTLTSFLKP